MRIIYKNTIYEQTEIERHVQEIGSFLYKNQIRTGDRLALYLKRDCRMVETIFALLRYGICYIPLDINAPNERNDKIIVSAKVKAVVCNTDCELCNIPIISLSDMDGSIENRLSETVLETLSAYYIATSGTTGVPKLVDISRKALGTWLRSYSTVFQKINPEKIICFSEYTFDLFLAETVLAAYLNMDIILADEEEQKNPLKMRKLILRYEIDCLTITPTRMRLLQLKDAGFSCIKAVKCIVFAGEALPGTLLADVQSNTNARILNAYGPTEATVFCCVADLTEQKTVTIGKPLPEYSVVLIRDNLELTNAGEIGELAIAGIAVANGYVDNKEATKQKFIFIPAMGRTVYRSGDLAKINEQGEYVFLGRIDYQLKLNGYRIEPEEIEYYLNQIPKIEQCVVCFNQESGELRAFCVTENKKDLDSSICIEFLKTYLPYYMIPRIYIWTPEMPMTDRGKIDRVKLVSWKEFLDEAELEAQSAEIDSETVSEEELADILLHLLAKKVDVPLERLSEDKTLSEIGLDSVSYMEIIVELEGILDIEFDENAITLGEDKTIGAWMKEVKQNAVNKRKKQ